MNTAGPMPRPRGGIRAALLFATLGLCCYAWGFLLGRQGAASFGTHETGALHSQRDISTGPAPGESSLALDNPTQAVGSPFFPGFTNALGVLEAKARQLDGSARAKEEMLLLTPLMRLLSTNDYAELWTVLAALHTSEPRDELQKRLLRSWSRLDPRAALKAIQSLRGVEPTDWRINTVISGWAEKEPEAAVAWIRRTLPGDQQNGALLAVVEGWSKLDPKSAAQFLAGLPGNGDRWSMAMELLNKLARVDPNAALSLLEETGLSDWRDEAFAFIAHLRVAENLPAALAWAQTLSNEKDRQTGLRAVVSRLAATQPGQAVEFLSSQPDSKQRDGLAWTLAETWAKQDPQSASQWVSQLPEGRLRQEAAGGLERSWAPEDPEAAACFVLNSLSPGEGRLSLLKDVAQTWSHLQWPNPAATALASQLPAGRDRDAFVAGMSQGLAPLDPEQAAQFAASIAPGDLQSEAFRMVSTFWVLHYGNAPDAGAWSASLPAGPIRAAAMAQIANDWATLDPVASGAWLESLPADADRVKAAEVYVDSAGWRRPDLASRLVDSIADENKRNQQIEALSRAWLKTDPASAQAWLEQTSLPDERKAALLKKRQ